MAVVHRYLQLSAAGFPACVVEPDSAGGESELRLRLVQALFQRPVTRPWVKAEMDVLLPGAGRAGLQALFRLLALGAVEVLDEPGAALPTAVAGLQSELQALAASRARLVLLDADGFVLAHAGLSLAQAESIALAALREPSALPWQRLVLQLGPRSPLLLAETLPAPHHPAWLGLCSRLARGCGR